MIIYLAINRLNGMGYVGKTKLPLNIRINCHNSHGRKPKTGLFARAIAAHGPDVFQWHILEEVSPEQADDAEQRWMLKLNTLAPHGYNMQLKPGDANRERFRHLSDAEREHWKKFRAHA